MFNNFTYTFKITNTVSLFSNQNYTLLNYIKLCSFIKLLIKKLTDFQVSDCLGWSLVHQSWTHSQTLPTELYKPNLLAGKLSTGLVAT